MDKKTPVIAQQQPRRGSVLYYLVTVLFWLACLCLLALVIFDNISPIFPYDSLWLLTAAAAGCVVTGLLCILIRTLPEIPGAAEWVVAGVLLAAFLGLQMFAAGMFGTPPLVELQKSLAFEYARSAARDGAVPWNFLQQYPGETAGFYLYYALFSFLHILGIGNFTQVFTTSLNMLMLCLTILLIFLSVRRVFGKQIGFLFFLLCLVFPPFYTAHALLGSEMPALLISAGGIHLWLALRSHWRAGKTGAAGVRFLLLGVLLGAGALLKAYLWVFWIAFAADWIVSLRGRRFFWLLGSFGLMLAVFFGGRLGLWAMAGGFAGGAQRALMPTHWIMAGLAGDGANRAGDLALGTSRSGLFEQMGLDLKTAGERALQLGPMGALRHANRLLQQAFGDVFFGTLPPQTSSAWRGNAVVKIWGFSLYAACIFWSALASLKALARKNHALGFLRLLLLGAMLFVLALPQGGSTALVCLPAMLLLAAEVPAPRLSAPVQKQEVDAYIHRRLARKQENAAKAPKKGSRRT